MSNPEQPYFTYSKIYPGHMRHWRNIGSLLFTGLAVFLFTSSSQPIRASVLSSNLGQITNPLATLNSVPDWASLDGDNTSSIAWGDMDNDGDLDLAVGCLGCSNKVYRNEGHFLQTTATWVSLDQDDTTSIAWGDIDGDGDLDLAVGNSNGPDKVYRNQGGMVQNDYAWVSADNDYTMDIAWGDMNGDGRFDLAVGGSNKVYLNIGTTLQTTATWAIVDNTSSSNIDWGDVNSDGRLDLVVLGNIYDPTCDYAGEIKVYLNKSGMLGNSVFWRHVLCSEVTSMALGDVNSDGSLDLAIGHYGFETTVHLNNRAGKFQTANFWRSADADFIGSLAWGDVDNDGDLDLAVGGENADRVYRNENGSLQETPAWIVDDIDYTSSLAWADVDNDGDLDLTMGKSGVPNRLYLNEIGKFQSNAIWNPPASSGIGAAWGDVNGDNTLDLAIDASVYLNKGGILSATPDWVPANSVSLGSRPAWGDVNGDGYLDLATTSGIFLNASGRLQPTPDWTPGPDTYISMPAWGDVDGDGDLDLATGNNVYLNASGRLQPIASWRAIDDKNISGTAWGDMDGDGDLDLAVGYYAAANNVYQNHNGILQTQPIWVSRNEDYTQSIAWGDMDGDGDLDLATGNSYGVNRVYRNNGQILETNASWTSLDVDDTQSIAWGDIDGDGDLDLVAGNWLQQDKLYINQQGELSRQGIPISDDVLTADSVALGDMDGDGDLDLVVVDRNSNSKVYRNLRPVHTNYPQPQNQPAAVTLDLNSDAVPTFNGRFSSALAPATDYAVAGVRQSGIIPIAYNLFSPGSERMQAIRVYYSLNGSFSSDRTQWRVAKPAPGTQTADLGASPYPTKTVANSHVFHWDVFGSGFFGQSDNVVVRIEALPNLKPVRNGVPGPFQRPYVAAQTFPFRVRGTQVRVLQNQQPVSPITQAVVYRLPFDQSQGAEVFRSNSGTLLRTNQQGYLEGRGNLLPGDRLFALAPITATEKYTIYHTSGTVTPTGLEGYTVQAGGVQTLTVSAANTLILYNLTVSLEWDARNDPTFMTQLENDLRRTSQVLYDLTNGQAALGDVRIYHDKGFWGTADVVITASNNQRPNAILGGSVLTPTGDVDINGTAIPDAYVPGQVRMGATWNRFGNPNGTLGEDWPRTLAHELGHYLFFVPDNYIGVTPDRQFVQLVDCQGSVMTDPYEESYSEFLTAEQWQTEACQRSVAAVYLGRPDWATITRFYPMLNGRGGNPGPSQLPLAVTRINTFAPPWQATTLAAPFFPLVNQQRQTISIPDGRGQAYLFKTGNNSDSTDDYLIGLGTPIGDLVQARGAAPGDRLCVIDYSHQPLRLGCLASVGNAPAAITLAEVTDWSPQVQVRGISTNTVVVTVTNVSASNLAVQLLPALGVASPEMPMTQQGAAFVQTVTAVDGAYFGFVRIWVPGSTPLREMIVEYSANEAWDGRARAWGGSTDAWGGRARAWGGRSYGWGGRARAWGAPVMSSDGQVSIFPLDNPFAGGAHYTLQSVTFPPNLPSWLTPVGQAYRVTSDGTLARSAVLFSYLGRDVPDGYENVLNLYYSPDEGLSWQRQETDLDTSRNQASAPLQGEGIYLLVATVPVEPALVAGWNNFGYSVQTDQSVAQALASIAGKYNIVYHYSVVPTPAWRTFAPAVPAPFAAVVNDLTHLAFGRAYWLYATEAATLYLGVGNQVTVSSSATGATSAPSAPATYYGWLPPTPGFAPTAGMRVTAQIDGVVCGETTVQLFDGQPGYVLRVAANDPQNAAACGVVGKGITFAVDNVVMAQSAAWSNQQTWFLPLSHDAQLGIGPSPAGRVFLPLVRK